MAYLIEKYKTDSFAKYLGKRDAWKEKEFVSDIYTILVKATENGEWDLLHHLEILDDAEQVPIKNNFYGILKITHFYHYKQAFTTQLPVLTSNQTLTQSICEWLIAYIQSDDREESLKKDLLSVQNYLSANYTNVFYRASPQEGLDMESILYTLYDEYYRSARFGLNSLLRIFFSQPKQETFEIGALETPKDWTLDIYSEDWLGQVNDFAQDYQTYYFYKYGNKETGLKPFNKFLNLVTAIPNENPKFLIWFYEAIENTNEFLKNVPDKWSETLLYAPNGEYALSFAKVAIKFSLFKQHQKSLSKI